MNFSTFINENTPIFLDGGMGTQLDLRGQKMGGESNLSAPEAVKEIHSLYAKAGSHIIITNTLTMNRIYLESHRLDLDVCEVNLKGAKLAREAAGTTKFVLGDIGPTGKVMKPYGSLSKEDAFEAYKEQAAILVEGGVDGFIVETMLDLNEALCALKACKAVSDLPVMVSMSFSTTKKGGRTMMGNSAKDIAEKLTEAGAQIIGANCGDLNPDQMAEIVGNLSAATHLPVAIQPNAGLPKLVDGKTQFDMDPESFAQGIKKSMAAGAKLFGGCCGTSPAHIEAMVKIFH